MIIQDEIKQIMKNTITKYVEEIKQEHQSINNYDIHEAYDYIVDNVVLCIKDNVNVISLSELDSIIKRETNRWLIQKALKAI